jgi:thiol-disulfide isomerase/thioredoxin
MNKTSIAILLFVILLLGGCIDIKQPYTKLPPGIWRGVLYPDKMIVVNEKIPDKDIVNRNFKFEAVALGELPFNFEVVYPTPDSFYIVIHNGEERIQVTDIRYGLDRSTAKDTITMEFPIYNTKIEAIYEESIMEGRWIDMNKPDYSIPFAAFHGKPYRFTELKKQPTADLSGKWAVTFGTDGDKPYPAIGEFIQIDNQITGTFLTETGDYRYLDGTVQGNKMYMSAFDGSVAYLFEAKIMEDGSLQGVFKSGKHYTTTWEGVRNDQAALSSALDLTKASGKRVSFTFPDSNGQPFTFEPDGRPTVLQIMGSWCRNCYDESLFLNRKLQEYGEGKIRVISIAFERPQEEAAAIQRLKRYKERLSITYPVLLGAVSIDKDIALDKLPFLTNFKAYPTTVFLDKSGAITKIYTGISGPASTAFKAYEQEFDNTIQQLIQ